MIRFFISSDLLDFMILMGKRRLLPPFSHKHRGVGSGEPPPTAVCYGAW